MLGMEPDQRGDVKIFDFPVQGETAIVDVVISPLYATRSIAKKAAARKEKHYLYCSLLTS